MTMKSGALEELAFVLTVRISRFKRHQTVTSSCHTKMWALFVLSATALVSTLIDSTDAARLPRKRCIIDINKDLPDNQPLILQKRSGTIKLVFPEPVNKTGILSLQAGEQYLLACPETKINITNTQEALVTCIEGKIFSANRTQANFTDFGCQRTASSTVRRTNTSCYGGNIWAEIGFEVNNTWLPQIGVCHNQYESSTLYSKHVLFGNAIAAYEHESKRPKFQEGGFYSDINANRVYTWKGQLATMEDLLGSSEQAALFMNQGKQLFFSRGHLAPDADFIFGLWQFASYYFINVAPQWQIFNGGNWLLAENAVRDYARNKSLELDIYTGTYGITSLVDANNNPVDIYLVPGDPVSRIPAPRYYWKVLHDRKTNKGVALVGLNDPYATNPGPELCRNMCNKLKWLNLKSNSVKKGYMYCCEVDDLRSNVPYVPVSKVKGILL